MNNFNYDLCDKCGKCIEVCPVGVLGYNDSKQPAVIEERKEMCVSCGHCEAVCPKNAVVVSGPLLQSARVIEQKPVIKPETLSNYFRLRRSVRKYEQEAVPRQLLEEMLDVVRYAPSGVNKQPVRWIVLYDTAVLRKITEKAAEWMKAMVKINHPMAGMLAFESLVSGWEKGLDPICRHAPHVIMVYGQKGNRMAPTDATIALTHLELLAPAFGLGACWAGYFSIAASQSEDVKLAIGIPDDHTQLGSMMIGFPKYEYKRVPKRNKLTITWK